MDDILDKLLLTIDVESVWDTVKFSNFRPVYIQDIYQCSGIFLSDNSPHPASINI